MMSKSIESCTLLAGCHPNAMLAAIQSVAKTLCQITGMQTPDKYYSYLMERKCTVSVNEQITCELSL